MAFPRVHAHFTVHSGHLCYGELHNIPQGALAEPSHGLTAVQPTVAGTVMTHKLDYNFVAHESVDVLQEIDEILRISGSPYEEDSGSKYNNEKTMQEGVLVLNRYDWVLYDKRALDVVGEDEFDPSTFAPRIGAGLVDYAEAKAEVMFWKDVPEDHRDEEQRPHGLWLDIPQNEYLFGRFGFDDKQSAARSFLFFGIQTVFTQTVIAGMQHPLRKYETHEEQFQRRLQDGYDFRRTGTLKMMAVPSRLGTSPADGDLLILGHGSFSYRSNIMPADVRIAVCNDAELFSIFKYSRVYWDGSE
ncbi:MAG: hypothetical protein Q9176_002906 [Flavoplaca citrina]